jgi:hypothetical protein
MRNAIRGCQPCWTTVVRRRLTREAADGVQAGGLIDVGVDLLSGRDVLVAEHDLGVPGWDAAGIGSR